MSNTLRFGTIEGDLELSDRRHGPTLLAPPQITAAAFDPPAIAE
jgi:hypothetical protein